MGKGDKRSKKGKIVTGSYGNSRPHKAQKAAAAKKVVAKKD
ncbi:MAG: 30S ribosomal protein THX [Bacteroidota bacterium]